MSELLFSLLVGFVGLCGILFRYEVLGRLRDMSTTTTAKKYVSTRYHQGY